jgi:inositol transport system substrate-binding protein
MQEVNRNHRYCFLCRLLTYISYERGGQYPLNLSKKQKSKLTKFNFRRMYFMKSFKFLALVLAVIMVMGLLAACGSAAPAEKEAAVAVDTAKAEPAVTEPAKDEKIVIGVSLLGIKNEFIMNIKNAMDAKAKELGVEIIVSDGQDSAEKQVSQVENFIAQKVDAIVLNPISMDGCKPAVEAANAAGIPILTVNTLVANQDKCTAFIGSDAVESGRIEMEYAAKLMNGKGNIVIMYGQMGHDAQIGRKKGLDEILAKNPDIKIVADKTGNWSRAEGMALMENWLQSGKEINAVLAQNDEMALGAMKALEDAKLLDKTLVFGIDAIPDALKAIQDGKMAGTVFQDAKGQGAGSIEAAVKVAKGEKIDSTISIPYVLVTKDDVSKYLK